MTILLVNGMGYRSRPSCRRPVPLFSLPTLDKRPTGEKACPTNIFVKTHQNISETSEDRDVKKINGENKIAQTRQLPVQHLRNHGTAKSLCEILDCTKVSTAFAKDAQNI